MVRRRSAARTIASAVVIGGVLSACGKMGPPLAPLRLAPARVTDFAARRIASTIYVRITVPDKNDNATMPADLERLELLAFTDDPAEALKAPLANRTLELYATKVATIAVRPPPPPEPTTEEEKQKRALALAAAPPDARPVQGETIIFTESVGPAIDTPVDRAEVFKDALPAEPPPAEREAPRPLLSPPEKLPPVRYYTVVGVGHKGQRSAYSTRLAVPLAAPPAAPPAPALTHSLTVITVTWPPAPGAPEPVQKRLDPKPAAAAPAAAPGGATPAAPVTPATPAAPVVLASRSLAPQTPLYTYNVYDASIPAGTPGALTPLNPQPLTVLTLDVPGVVFGKERCFIVRALRPYGDMRVESEASPPGCVTPTDTFPPPPPQNLTGVATEGAISLIWDSPGDPDIAGFLVLRAEAPGGTLQPITPEPIAATTFRDATVRPGVRYIYAIVAVDRATPANRSAESNRFEESAR